MDITVKNLQSSIPIPQSTIKTIAFKTGKLLRLSKRLGEVSIVLVGSKRMRRINQDYLGHDYVTDVITFDLKDSAEIIICPQVAYQNAKFYGVSLKKELLLYVVHGFLHLAGFDDHNSQDIKRMRSKEQSLLDRLI
jgi:probable rRNA maturation factor